MSDEPRRPELAEDELEAEEGELLPDREATMLIDPSGDALLGPPALSDPYEVVETPPIIENPPPTE